MDNQAVVSFNMSQKATTTSVFCKQSKSSWHMLMSYCKPDSCIIFPTSAGKHQSETTAKHLQTISFWEPTQSLSKLARVQLPAFIRKLPPIQPFFFSPCYTVEALLAITISIIPGGKLPSSITSKCFSGICFLAQLKNFFPLFRELAEIKRPQWHSCEASTYTLYKGCLHTNVKKN